MASSDYEVGYGKPPKHTRWVKGQSGNIKGKKKGTRALKTDLDAALKATHTIKVGGKEHTDTTQALAMLTLALRAANGDTRAQKLLVDLVLAIFGPGERGGGESKLSKHDQALLDRLLDAPRDGDTGIATEEPCVEPDRRGENPNTAEDDE